MTMTYKVQPYHVVITTRSGIDNIHASFSEEEWALNWGGQFTKDAIVMRIEIEVVRAGSRTALRSWTKSEGWQTTSYAGNPEDWLK